MSIANNILQELLVFQRNNIEPTTNFEYLDLVRLSKYIPASPFYSNNKCCTWTSKKKNIRNYITFHYRNKKTTLSRLFYINYIGDLARNEYVSFSCNNRGHCLNINHIVKKTYSSTCKLQNDIKPMPESGYIPNIILSFN